MYVIAALVVWSGRCGGGEPQRRFDDPPGTAAQQPAVQPAIAESAQQRAVLPPVAGHQQVVAGLDAALGYARESGIPYGIGFIKNRYVGRTFIKPTQKERESSVRLKLSVLKSAVKGKNIVLVDDSIVRGTTSARTIRLLREAGAAEVHYRISAPPFAHPCYFGTDIPDEKDLIATGHTVEEINRLVGSDTLGYLSIEHVQQLAIHSKCGFCTGCFTGHYPVPAPNETMDIVYDKPLSQSQTKKRL